MVREEEADGEKYVAYILTPNMWEDPWVRHLVGGLPISRFETLDLWSPPPAHPRRRRLSAAVQSSLPAVVRPTRRRLRRLVQPHEFSVFIYNTWGLDHVVRSEFTGLLSSLKHVGLVSVDEPTRDSTSTYRNVTFAVRIGFDAEKYHAVRNLLVAPLGVPKGFVPPRSIKGIAERRFSWSFLGEVKNPRRRAMVAHLRNVGGEAMVHAISSWDAQDSLRGLGYSEVVADSIFAPSPPANVHCECYRTYEALECDAIPVVDTSYYRDAFGAPFPIVEPSWEDAPQVLNSLLDDASSLERLHEECRAWWKGVRQSYPENVRRLAESVAGCETRSLA